MINFCKKSVHFLFNNIITSTTLTSQHEHSITADHHRNPMQSGGAGLSILTNYDDVPKPNNVIESSSLMINGSWKTKEAIAPEIIKQDDIEIKITGLRGGYADGLASCTESLGFESCTERSMSNEFDHHYEKTRVKKKPKKEKINMRMKLFPPPLKTLNDNGKPVFVLKPVRKDGRLELTEVQIHRKESLRAFRENGRLRMHLVELNRGNDRDVKDKSGDTKDKKAVEEDWKLPENCSGGEDCRWLNEMVVSHGHHHHHQHHNMHGWGHQCVTIRGGESGDGSIGKTGRWEEDDGCIRIESIKSQRGLEVRGAGSVIIDICSVV